MYDLFLSCDWGTSSFRLRLINAGNLKLIAESYSGEGVAKVYERWQQDKATTERLLFYQLVLRRHISKIEAATNRSLEGIPIVMSGMASSTIGMQELPYKALPLLASGDDLHYELIHKSQQFNHSVILISGARTESDVMRGEETQLAGCMQQMHHEEGIFIFPGTHSKHIYVTNEYVTDFETYMTGEIFNLLSTQSILSKSVSAGGSIKDAANGAAFAQGVLKSRHQHLLHSSFTVRTNDLLQLYGKEQNYWHLSGLVIGAELTALLQKSAGAITIVGEGTIAQAYQSAFKTLGKEAVHIVDAGEALIKAHAAIWRRAAMS